MLNVIHKSLKMFSFFLLDFLLATLIGDFHYYAFLQIAVEKKKKEVKSKGEKEIYKLLSAEFQRIARRDKKAFLSDQCKEIEENNRMGKTRDLFKKIRDTKGTFHAKMGSVKDNKLYLYTICSVLKTSKVLEENVSKNLYHL